jgi:N-methylhydantoinase B
MDDSEKMARAKLVSLPDGTWRNRLYWSRTKRVKGTGEEEVHPFKVMCTMTKEGDTLTFDAAGTSPQNEDYCNATLVATRSNLFIALAGFLFWDIPWNAGMAALIQLAVPEGTVLNCRYPASCGYATRAGLMFTDAAQGCIARLMYAAGQLDYVNSSYFGEGGGGPGIWYGGHSQHGTVVGQGVYDLFASGNGATPLRDGNNTGGSCANAHACISDVEFTEMFFPFLYLARTQYGDGGGYGKLRGGMGLESIMMVYGTKDLTVDYLPTPSGGEVRNSALFGGYSIGNVVGGSMLLSTSDMREEFSKRVYPVAYDELGAPWGQDARAKPGFSFERQLGGIRIDVSEYDILGYQMAVGGGFGDPLDREPIKVVRDVKDEAVTIETAAKVYGVIIDPETLEFNQAKTEQRRSEIRQERLRNGKAVTPGKSRARVASSVVRRILIRMHEYLQIVEKEDGDKAIICIKCGNEFCRPDDNYKKWALRWTRDVREMKKVPESEESITYYQEYICPGCGTLLQVDTWCPEIDSDEPLWDIQVKV